MWVISIVRGHGFLLQKCFVILRLGNFHIQWGINVCSQKITESNLKLKFQWCLTDGPFIILHQLKWQLLAFSAQDVWCMLNNIMMARWPSISLGSPLPNYWRCQWLCVSIRKLGMKTESSIFYMLWYKHSQSTYLSLLWLSVLGGLPPQFLAMLSFWLSAGSIWPTHEVGILIDHTLYLSIKSSFIKQDEIISHRWLLYMVLSWSERIIHW